MQRKDRVDAFGLVSLVGFAALLGFNQVVIKIVNDGLQPVFFAGLRSVGAMVCVWAFLRVQGVRVTFQRVHLIPGTLMGIAFALEFIFLFIALDLTTVARTSVLFYTMPIWFALAAHFWLPGERLTGMKTIGLLLAFAGVTWTILDRASGDEAASIWGDLFALIAAFGWASIAFIVRGTAIKEASPQMQLMWQLTVSALILMIVAPLFGPLLRDPLPLHWAGLAFQVVAIATAGFMFWFWLLTVYPASSVTAFGFLAPIFGVGFGWLILGEQLGVSLIGSLVLVAFGLWLVNRPTKSG
jgi:drug/metabolite transporter (DMT)-like permease